MTDWWSDAIACLHRPSEVRRGNEAIKMQKWRPKNRKWWLGRSWDCFFLLFLKRKKRYSLAKKIKESKFTSVKIHLPSVNLNLNCGVSHWWCVVKRHVKPMMISWWYEEFLRALFWGRFSSPFICFPLDLS